MARRRGWAQHLLAADLPGWMARIPAPSGWTAIDLINAARDEVGMATVDKKTKPFFDAIVTAACDEAERLPSPGDVQALAVRLIDLAPALLDEARGGRADLLWVWRALERVFLHREYGAFRKLPRQAGRPRTGGPRAALVHHLHLGSPRTDAKGRLLRPGLPLKDAVDAVARDEAGSGASESVVSRRRPAISREYDRYREDFGIKKQQPGGARRKKL